MMLEESLGRPMREARVRYHADNVTVRVAIDEAMRAEVRAAIVEARRLRRSIERPGIVENENLCKRCSLAPVCLPEEVRQSRDPDYEAPRLFPPEDDRTVMVVSYPADKMDRTRAFPRPVGLL